MFLDLRYFNIIGVVCYIVEIFFDELELEFFFIKNNNFIKNIINLILGIVYIFRIFVVSKYNIRSIDSCYVK